GSPRAVRAGRGGARAGAVGPPRPRPGGPAAPRRAGRDRLRLGDQPCRDRAVPRLLVRPGLVWFHPGRRRGRLVEGRALAFARPRLAPGGHVRPQPALRVGCGGAGQSLLPGGGRRLVAMFALSAPFWWAFEVANWRLENWKYVGPTVYGGHAHLVL